MNSRFIVIDGMDGAGKGEQIKRLKAKYTDGSVVFTREPGGTPMAEKIREILLDPNGPPSNPLCDSFLFWAARASHIEKLIRPSLRAGKHVISDRYDSSSVFQIYGEQSNFAWKELMERMFWLIHNRMNDLECVPDIYIILDLPAEIAYERRATDTTSEKNKFDLKELNYHRRVREGFRKFATSLGSSRIVNANRSIDEVWIDIERIVHSTLTGEIK